VKATAVERGEHGRLGVKTWRRGALTGAEAVKAMAAWRAQTPAVGSGAAAALDTTVTARVR
jgi:hypothetical protein